MTHPSTPTTARALAIEQLDRIQNRGAYVGLTQSHLPDDADPREVRQATDYVAGVTRWRRYLDFILAHYYRGDFDAMESTLQQILRVGLYDLLLQDTPPHAAINEAVELAKGRVRPGAGGLVNGILRTVQRSRERLPTPSEDDPAEALALTHSHPTWMVRRWLERFGREETEALLRWNNTRPIYGLRINLLKTTVEAFTTRLDEVEVEWSRSPYLDDVVRVASVQPILRSGWLDDGVCAIQDESAALVVRLLDPQPRETIVDGCAAPGGKTLYIAERMHDRGRVLAFDVHEGRLGLIKEGAQAHDLHGIRPIAADLRDLAERDERPQADRVLLDVPCSGLGVLAKRADLRWNREAAALDELTDLQDALLDAATALVRPGGLLVYSTCTIAPEENADRIAAFLKRHPDYALESGEGLVPDEVLTADGALQTLPHRHHTDGAFAVRLRRT
ncbi:MAG: 16S rRNA (cytosine(967)-C(5))-methyltransferase RsmB [Bacteroidetes bacterium]|jgi:16S rRNA (cytosine967-C5)-methyltransferase|nr:16S rRNA (cytosine(967)-C(5))-methyltransferase RsmB [Bacteroidota bacterium]